MGKDAESTGSELLLLLLVLIITFTLMLLLMLLNVLVSSHTESFFQIPLEEVKKRTIVFQVFDWDYITSNDEIGEVQVLFCYHRTISVSNFFNYKKKPC